MRTRGMYGPFNYGIWTGAEPPRPLPPLPQPPSFDVPAPEPPSPGYVKRAVALAQDMHENFVGVVLYLSGKWEAHGFPDKEMLEDWYGKIAYKKPADYDYIAVFDKSRYGAEPYGSSYSPSRERKTKTSSALIIGGLLVGGALLAGSFVVPSRPRKNGSR